MSVESYKAIKVKEILHATTWMDFTKTILSKGLHLHGVNRISLL